MTPYILVDNYRIVGEIFAFIPTNVVTSEPKMEAPAVTVHGTINTDDKDLTQYLTLFW